MGGAKSQPVVTITSADLKANGGQYKLTGKYALKVNGNDSLSVMGGAPAVVYPVSQAQIASGEFELIQGQAVDVTQVTGRGRESGAWAMPVYHAGPGTWPGEEELAYLTWSFHVPGTLAANVNIRFIVPVNCTVISISAVASNDSDATMIFGISTDTNSILEAAAIGDSNVPVGFDSDDWAGTAELVVGQIAVLTLDYDGTSGAAAADVTLIVTALVG